MDSYAVVQNGGKQYLVKTGQTVRLERIGVEVGKKTELSPVLAVSDGMQLKVGTPVIRGVKVVAEVLEHIRDDKVIAFKMKRRKGYARKKGHRQELTVVKIESIA